MASKLPPVLGHKGQLQEVINNLVRNAIDAMDSIDGQRALNVSTELNADDAVTVAIADTGPGLGSGKTSAIFEAFVTTKPDGMGLGLPICRMIVERHEGQLLVSSADPRGAIFRIILPQANLHH